jgi:hypothetical protein
MKMAKKISLEINIADIIQLEEFDKYKLHAANFNGNVNPLDEFLEDENNWKNWNQYRPSRDDFNRDYIFSMMEFYPKPNTWLFGGIFKVIERKEDSYIVDELDKYKKFTGRLLLNFEYKDRARRLRLENYIDYITVNQIFEYRYAGEIFPGFDKINHDFTILENIFKLNKSDWKTALENVKGVYLLTDRETGKSYVGSAYGNAGIWSRWSDYINTFHGWNDKMVALVNKKGKRYIRENLKFSILEIHGMFVSDEQIIERENYWKEKLMTREHGYNLN